MESVEPDLVVNAAAYTAVVRAESEPGIAMQINAVKESRRVETPVAHRIRALVA